MLQFGCCRFLVIRPFRRHQLGDNDPDSSGLERCSSRDLTCRGNRRGWNIGSGRLSDDVEQSTRVQEQYWSWDRENPCSQIRDCASDRRELNPACLAMNGLQRIGSLIHWLRQSTILLLLPTNVEGCPCLSCHATRAPK